ncbi:MAG: hypothetical protein KY437_07230 [Actinobacteria bacterium]|nr:hypothetical protein [Actinomycetota bacterium]
MRGARAFRVTAVVFTLAFLFHNGDHFRRGVDTITPYVLLGGVVLGIVSIVAIALVAVGHEHAPLAAVVAGAALGLGAAASHLLPEWSVFSDSFVTNGAEPITWAAAISEVAASLLFAAAGWHVLRRPAPPTRGVQRPG